MFGAIVALLIVVAAFKGAASAAYGPQVVLVASRSYCVPATGDRRVTFHLTFENSGDELGSSVVTPVSHYDGRWNEAALDELAVSVAPGGMWSRRADVQTSDARARQVTACGVIVPGRGELAIDLRR